jgi:hypothetical protein
MLRRSSGSGYEKPQSGNALCAVFLRHIWGGGHCYAMPYYPSQTSYTAGTLCAICAKKVYKIVYSRIYYLYNNENNVILRQGIIRWE